MHVDKTYTFNADYEPSRVDIHDDLIGGSAFFSAMAYREPGRIADRLTAYGAIRVATYNVGDLQAFFCEFDDFAVVAFRGILDRQYAPILKFWKTMHYGVKVHFGFANSITRLAPSIMEELEKLDTAKKLLYTGHSFGGALALLMAFRHKPHAICTIGTPKVGGGRGFIEKFKDIEVYRLQTAKDIITSLPPSLPLLMEYKHVGEKVHLDGIDHRYETHRLDVYLKEIARFKNGK